MGKDIIFIGGGNLNRNKERQSMYSGRYHKPINSNRSEFYKELCKESKKTPLEKVRLKKIEQLQSRYQTNACSQQNMEKVFIAYFECFHRPFKKKSGKNKLSELPIFLEKNKVDKRIIKRIIKTEGIQPLENKTKKIQTEYGIQELPVRKKEEINRFHELLNQYLIESHFDNNSVMNSELKKLLSVYKRDSVYIEKLKKIYHYMLTKNTSFDKIRRKHKLMIAGVDRIGLIRQFYLYKTNHLL